LAHVHIARNESVTILSWTKPVEKSKKELGYDITVIQKGSSVMDYLPQIIAPMLEFTQVPVSFI